MSLRRIILLAFTPAVCLCILISSLISFLLYQSQLQKVATLNALNTVSQGVRNIDSWLDAIFEDLVLLEQYTKVNDLYLQRDLMQDGVLNPKIVIRMNNEIQQMKQSYEKIIDSIFWGVELPNGSCRSVYYSGDRAFDCSFSFDSAIGPYSLREVPWNQYTWVGPHTDSILLERTGEERQYITLFKVIQRSQSGAKYLLYVNFKLSFFEDILTDNNLGESMYLALVTPDEMITFPEEERRTLRRENLEDIAAPLGNKEIRTVRDTQGQRLFFVYDTIRINRGNWQL
jgi:hypothetical protein